MSIEQALYERALIYGEDSVRMTAAAGAGHPSSALSLVHIVSALFYRMRHDPENPWNTLSDRLVLSEGHSVPVVYAAMAEMGYKIGKSPRAARALTREDLLSLRDLASPLDGHPNPVLGVPFFDTATGSLGQGLSNANGLVLGNRVRGLRRKIYCIAGDSEVREGQYDEAMRFASKYRLEVILILNVNGYGQSGATKELMPMDYRAELQARRWQVLEVDGHDVSQLLAALDRANEVQGSPVAILANTVKGWGVGALQKGNPHGKPLSPAEVEKAVGELRTLSRSSTGRLRPQKPDERTTRWLRDESGLPVPNFAALDKDFAQKGKMAPRKAYGYALRELGKVNEKVVVLDAEVSNSTFTVYFRDAFPERFFECAIAEQNMVGVGGGLAASGLVPFINSFGKFLVMGYAQWEMNGQSGLNIKAVGSHVGITPCSDGPSQMALSDVPYMMSLPGIVVLSASDAVQGYQFVSLAAAHEGWMYLRNYRPDMPLLYGPDTKFRVGGSNVLQRGDAVTLVSHGYMVHVAKEAAARLEKEKGLKVSLVDAYSLKPLDTETILGCADRTEGRLLTVEDNYAGLGPAVSRAAAARGGYRVEVMAVESFPKSARREKDIFSYCGLSVEDILARAQAMLVK
ncbi:MAG: transketolase [Planctomycetes bacterium]|nr:transketolase [Planctomycetota bacterium]